MKKNYVLKNKARFVTLIIFTFLIISSFFAVTDVYGRKEPEFKTIVVGSGDTLWNIAKEYSDCRDIREFVYDIKKLNKLADSTIYAGMTLNIPVK